MAGFKRKSGSVGGGGKHAKSDANEGPSKIIELDAKKRVTVKRFMGASLVDIREFYTDKESGEDKPGKKGILLSREVWDKLMDAREEIEATLDELEGGKKEEKKAEEKEEEEEEEEEEDEE